MRGGGAVPCPSCPPPGPSCRAVSPPCPSCRALSPRVPPTLQGPAFPAVFAATLSPSVSSVPPLGVPSVSPSCDPVPPLCVLSVSPQCPSCSNPAVRVSPVLPMSLSLSQGGAGRHQEVTLPVTLSLCRGGDTVPVTLSLWLSQGGAGRHRPALRAGAGALRALRGREPRELAPGLSPTVPERHRLRLQPVSDGLWGHWGHWDCHQLSPNVSDTRWGL